MGIVILSQFGKLHGIMDKFEIYVGDRCSYLPNKYPVILEQYIYRGDEITIGEFASKNDAEEIVRQISIAIIKEQKVYEIPQDGMIEYIGR